MGITILNAENLAQSYLSKKVGVFGRDLQKSAGGNAEAFTLYGPYVVRNASPISISANNKANVELSQYSDYAGNDVVPPTELETPAYMFLTEFGIQSTQAHRVALNSIGVPSTYGGMVSNPWASIANLSTTTVNLSESTVQAIFWSTVEFNAAG